MPDEVSWWLNALSLGLVLTGSIIQLWISVTANRDHGKRDSLRRYIDSLDQHLIEIQAVPSAPGLKVQGQEIDNIYAMLEGGTRMANKENKRQLNVLLDQLEVDDDRRHVWSIGAWSIITAAATLQGVLVLIG